MKKLLMLFALAVALCLVVSGTMFAQGKRSGRNWAGKPLNDAPEATGAALWNHLAKVDYAKKWSMWPGKEAFYPGKEPHGMLLTTYVNGSALKAIEGKKGKMPYGAIIVKENYSPEKKLMATTVMRKIWGYDPEGNDWFWARYQPDGKIDAEGKVEGCIKCHSKQKDNDYIFTGKLK